MRQPGNEIWDEASLRDPHAVADKRARVRAMFESIAGRYDLLNRVLSLGLDRRWRRRAAALAAVKAGERVLDVCCGSGDLAREFVRAEPGLEMVVGVDFSEGMLAQARGKGPIRVAGEGAGGSDRYKQLSIHWLCGDAERLGFAGESFDCVSCAFGVRNLGSVSAGLGEMRRVLVPGGRLVILEFSVPENRWLRRLYGLYFRFVLPAVGSMMSGDRTKAYHYLPASVRRFDTAGQFVTRMHEAGFSEVETFRLSGSAVLCLRARKR